MPGNCILGGIKAIDRVFRLQVDCFFYFRDLFQGSFCNRFYSLFYRLPRSPPNRRKPHFFGWHCLSSWLVYFGARYPLCTFSTTGTGYDTVNRYALPGAFFGSCVFVKDRFQWRFWVSVWIRESQSIMTSARLMSRFLRSASTSSKISFRRSTAKRFILALSHFLFALLRASDNGIVPPSFRVLVRLRSLSLSAVRRLAYIVPFTVFFVNSVSLSGMALLYTRNSVL